MTKQTTTTRKQSLDDLMRTVEAEKAGWREREEHQMSFYLSAAEKLLLRETAHRGRTSQAGVLRLGVRLVARELLSREAAS